MKKSHKFVTLCPQFGLFLKNLTQSHLLLKLVTLFTQKYP
jgi:hypothetical protein